MRALRATVRVAVLLCLAAAVVSLLALGGEYPGDTPAGRRIAVSEVLPLALLPWVHLAALELPPGRGTGAALVVAALSDGALLLRSFRALQAGAAPLALALPFIAALLLASVLGLAWRTRRPARGARAN